MISPSRDAPGAPTPPGGPSEAGSAPPPLRSAHTPNFTDLLTRQGISLLVTTYQAGKLVVTYVLTDAAHNRTLVTVDLTQ